MLWGGPDLHVLRHRLAVLPEVVLLGLGQVLRAIVTKPEVIRATPTPTGIRASIRGTPSQDKQMRLHARAHEQNATQCVR